jgi:hypothetical protein
MNVLMVLRWGCYIQHKAGFALPEFLLPEHDAVAADGAPMTVTIPLQPVSRNPPYPKAIWSAGTQQRFRALSHGPHFLSRRTDLRPFGVAVSG